MPPKTIQNLAEGCKRFQKNHYPQRRELHSKLQSNQDPRVLFVTCADSRIEPSFILQTEPGDLFISWNPGNLVPPNGALPGGAAAWLEFALKALPVTDVIVCGHSNWGAMKGLVNKSSVDSMPIVSSWLRYAEASVAAPGPELLKLPLKARIEMLAKENCLVQLNHLQTYPEVIAGLTRGDLRLYAWYGDIASGGSSCFDPTSY